jgi:hypothetical protein
MTRRTKVLAVTLVAAAAAGVSVPVALGGDTPDPAFRTLHRPERPGDVLPASHRSGPLAAIDRHSARRVGTIDGHAVYLAPGPGHTVCVVDVDRQGVGAGCAARGTMTARPAYVAWRDGDAATATAVVLVPDAYDTAEIDGRRIAVHDNVALGRLSPGRHEVELEGAATLEGPLDLWR